MKKHSKKYQKIQQKLKSDYFTLEEALDFLLKNKSAKFDETLELHINLNLKKGKEKAPFRFIINPPHKISKMPKIAVLMKESLNLNKEFIKDIETSEKKILKQIKSGKINFDILIATKDYAEKISAFAKILGPKGLMPQEKNQTLTDKPQKIIENILKGQREIKADDQDLIHTPVGKISLGKEKIKENINYILTQIKHHKPTGIKGDFIQKAYVSSTMGPGIKLDLKETR